MKKVLNIVFVCVAVLSSCAKTSNDDNNYYYIDGNRYYRVPIDYFDEYEYGKGYIQTFHYDNTGIKTLNPGHSRCDFCKRPSDNLRKRLKELNNRHGNDPDFISDDRKYYLIAELAFIRHESHRVNVDGIFSPWRIAIGRPKSILINQGFGEQRTKVIEIIDDYIE